MKLLTGMINFSNLRIFQLVLMVLVCAAISGQAQQFYFKGYRTKDAISFSVVKNLIIIPLYINNKGPFNFILDTGVSALIVTDPTFIDSLGLKAARSIKVAGLGRGEQIDAYVVNDISASLGKSYVDDLPTVILKKDIFGLSNYLGTKIHGLLGYYFFNSFTVELRYAAKKMIFSLPGSRRNLKGEKIPLVIEGNKPYVNISIETAELGKLNLKALIDNGASHAISLERLNEQPFPVPATSITANLGVGMSGPIDGNIGRISSLTIGGFTLKKVVTAYPKYDDVAAKVILKERNANLGADILSHFNVTFDYMDSVMYLRKNSQFGRPFEHDMSGIEVYMQEGEVNHFLISRIEPGSPAQKSGILVDDEILLINFIPAANLKLNDINGLFKSADGRTIILSIQRGKERLIKVFKLKQRI